MNPRPSFSWMLVLAAVSGPTYAQETSRVSVDSSGQEGNSESKRAAISSDGRYVAFESAASNLVQGDTNFGWDIFVHDLDGGTTTQVNVDSSGSQGYGNSFAPSISADGRFVAFWSTSDTLVPGDTNDEGDVFVHDRQTGMTERVSVGSAGEEGNAPSIAPSISADGQVVAFHGQSRTLVPGDTNEVFDVFVHDRTDGSTTRVSVSSQGAQGTFLSWGPSISGDGRYVAFSSEANNLIGGDTNSSMDVFVHDRHTGQTRRVSIHSSGAQGLNDSESASISVDGRYVAFHSRASNLVSGDANETYDVFVHDRQTGTTTLESVNSDGVQGDGSSMEPAISADGRYVAFHSASSNLVPADSPIVDVYLRDRQNGLTRRESVTSGGLPAIGPSYSPSVDANGAHVAFESTSINLVPGDTNHCVDVFVHVSCGSNGTRDCVSNPNSTGSPAELFECGSQSSSAGTLRFTAVPVPVSTGILFHGANSTQLPFGNGFLCTTSDLVRGAVIQPTVGHAVYTYDNHDPKHSLQAYVGSSRNFQYWFRDAMGGGALFNTSDAISLTILP